MGKIATYLYSCCLTLLLPLVGWDIMGYESAPLPSYRWSSNRLYKIILSYNFSVSSYLPLRSLAGSATLLLLFKVLVQPPHEPT